LGTLARYGLSGLVQRFTGFGFPWGTFAANMGGCFLFGLVWSLAEYRLSIGTEVRTVVLVGFMGGFTTFSSFAFETAQMIRDAQWMLAAVNLAAQNLTGIALLFLGLGIGRMM
jgi:CrcB protein